MTVTWGTSPAEFRDRMHREMICLFGMLRVDNSDADPLTPGQAHLLQASLQRAAELIGAGIQLGIPIPSAAEMARLRPAPANRSLEKMLAADTNQMEA